MSLRYTSEEMAWKITGTVAIGIVSSAGFMLAALLLFCAVNPWVDPKEIPVFGSRALDTLLFGAAGPICAFVTTRLIQGRRWAWRTALVVSLLILGFGALLLVAFLRPKNEFERSESGFGVGIAIILTIPSLTTSALLVLPSVRQRFAAPSC
jgi:hypothetical protein